MTHDSFWRDATAEVLADDYLQDFIFDGRRRVSIDAVRKLAADLSIGRTDLQNWSAAELHLVLLNDEDAEVRERARVEFMRRFEGQHSVQIAEISWRLEDA